MQQVAVSKLQDPGSMHGGLVHHVTAAQAIGPASALASPSSAMLSRSVRAARKCAKLEGSTAGTPWTCKHRQSRCGCSIESILAGIVEAEALLLIRGPLCC